ncbi:MAG: PfkB family carbohydrate kinase [Dermatophilaceae bacterium]
MIDRPTPARPSGRGVGFLVIGEALIDAVDLGAGQVVEHVGGSPANVAFGLGSLGHEVALATWIGTDARGDLIAGRCAATGVRLTDGSRGAASTSVALATLDRRGQASYTFDVTWSVSAVTGSYGHVHTGSIAATVEPGGRQVLAAVRAFSPTSTVSYDPNMRPTLMGSADAVRERVEELIALADVVKASDEDLQWLYPGAFIPDVLRRWDGLGPGVAVVTRGAEGAMYAVRSSRAREVTTVAARASHVTDTVGAGDSFMAGLLSGLADLGLVGGPDARRRLHTAGIDELRVAVDRAMSAAGATVAHAGAYAPTREELVG